MTPSHRAWAKHFIGQLEDRIALYRRIGLGRDGEAVIVSCLQDAIDRHRAMLGSAVVVADEAAAMPATAAIGTPSLDPVAGATGWDNPVFWAGGYFQPFAGTRRDRMLASAVTCRRLGYEAAAQGYDAHAADDRGEAAVARAATAVTIDETAQARLACVAAFTAGPQMGLFG